MMPLLWLVAVGCGRAVPDGGVVADVVDPSADGAPCSTGCSGPTPDEIEHLGDAAIAQLLAEVARVPVGTAELAVETLLFHGAETQDYLARVGSAPLPDAHARWLTTELSRDQVAVGLRLVARDGRILGHRDDVVTLGQKQHLLLRDMGVMGRADVNGKVKRVGVDHLWARF